VYFEPAEPLSQVLLAFVIGGMSTGAVPSLSSYWPAFLAFTVPALLPLLVRLFALGDTLGVTMGLLGSVYGAVLFAAARTTHRTIRRSLELRFENRGLIDRLSTLTTSLEQSNRTLEQRVAERSAELERQAEALEVARRREALGRLAGGVAHDFNNLLTVVIANASALVADRRLPEVARAELEEIQAASGRGAFLVRQLLAFSGKGRFEPRTVDLTSAVVDARLLLGRLVEEPHRLALELGNDALPVLLDPVQLQQVLVDLVMNARDAMPTGGTISLGTRRVDDSGAEASRPCAELWVGDTGVGMDEDTLARAFDPFFTTKGERGGAGLGLASAQAIVDRSGGRVAFESEPGAGSRVTIRFPLAAVAAPSESARSVEP
jgi:signal transduction histidine kinase